MTDTRALIPQLLANRGNRISHEVLSVAASVTLIAALAQLSVSLPFTPVPITGQTFGVAVVSLLWGRKRSFSVMASYLGLGAAGLPVFALAKSGLLIGPTLGYLVGMFVASLLMGALADLGWTKNFFKTYLAATLGSVTILTIGAFGLSFFIPKSQLWTLGVLPFLPGDIIKTLLASSIVNQSNRLACSKSQK